MIEYISVTEAKKLSPHTTITKQSLYHHLQNGTIPGIFENGRWFVKKSFVMDAIAWRKEAYTVDECLEIFQKQNNLVLPANTHDKLVRQNQDLRSDSPYQYFFFGKHFIESSKLDAFLNLLNSTLTIANTKENSISLNEAADIMETNHYRLLRSISSGQIPATFLKGQWYLDQKTVEQYKQNKELYRCVYDTSVSIVKGMHTVFDPEDRYNRAALIKYLKSGKYKDQVLEASEAGIIYEEKRFMFYPVVNAEGIEAEIASYIRTFGNSNEKLALYDELSWGKRYPRTKKAVSEYSETKKPMCAALLMNIFIHSQIKEIMDYSNDELSSLIADAEFTNRKTAKKYLFGFLNFVREQYDCIYTQEFFINTQAKSRPQESIYPYTEAQYIAIGRMSFNEKEIETTALIEKACQNARLSYTWFYTQMHYVGAFRKSDIDSNMPILPLPYSHEETLRRIREGEFDDDAIKLSIRFESEFNQSCTKPHKTQHRQNQRFMIMSIPTSLRKSFGLCYAVYCYHKQKHGTFSTFLRNTLFSKLYGAKYREVIGDSVFLNRRANKSYLDFIAQDVEHSHSINSQIMGYAVAQFARAHVRGAQTTSKYLSTQLDGLSINEITMMLFESGTCSFIPHYLLQIIYGENYTNAPVIIQNNTIIATKYTAYNSERLAKYIDDAFGRSQLAINSIMKQASINQRKELATEMLTNLVSKTAIAKHSGVSCLLAARRTPCAHLGRDCFGCLYAIYETSFFYSALEYVRKQYQYLQEAKTMNEHYKWRQILDSETLPAISEILLISENIYKVNVSHYKDNLVELIKSQGEYYGTLEV